MKKENASDIITFFNSHRAELVYFVDFVFIVEDSNWQKHDILSLMLNIDIAFKWSIFVKWIVLKNIQV